MRACVRAGISTCEREVNMLVSSPPQPQAWIVSLCSCCMCVYVCVCLCVCVRSSSFTTVGAYRHTFVVSTLAELMTEVDLGACVHASASFVEPCLSCNVCAPWTAWSTNCEHVPAHHTLPVCPCVHFCVCLCVYVSTGFTEELLVGACRDGTGYIV